MKRTRHDRSHTTNPVFASRQQRCGGRAGDAVPAIRATVRQLGYQRRSSGVWQRLVVTACGVSLGGCMPRACSDAKSSTDDNATLVALPFPQQAAVPRKNMVWIEPGVFLAGTPHNVLPRIVDEEMPGVQVTMAGYYIDQYPYPNEPGAIQATNLTREQAAEKCASENKRLCTELEWERACKGPNSTAYEYGAVHNPKLCPMGAESHLVPTGTNAGCRSGFDVFDMHGGAFEWTASVWNRRGPTDLAVVRGGSGQPSEVVGRCANARARRPDTSYKDVGFRCCAGPVNDAEVQLEVDYPEDPFKAVVKTSELAPQLQGLVAEAVSRTPGAAVSAPTGKFRISRVWRWFPIGNERLVVASGCAYPGSAGAGASLYHSVCGVVVVRESPSELQPLVFASSGWWLPSVQVDEDRRLLWVYGGDSRGKYRRKVAYLWGKVGVGEPEVPTEKTRK